MGEGDDGDGGRGDGGGGDGEGGDGSGDGDRGGGAAGIEDTAGGGSTGDGDGVDGMGDGPGDVLPQLGPMHKRLLPSTTTRAVALTVTVAGVHTDVPTVTSAPSPTNT